MKNDCTPSEVALGSIKTRRGPAHRKEVGEEEVESAGEKVDVGLETPEVAGQKLAHHGP